MLWQKRAEPALLLTDKRSDKVEEELKRRLFERARVAREKAYTPYSHFAVGAALLADNGQIYDGCNIENASFGLTNCAERTAVFRMVADGARRLLAIAVVADAPRAISPCGACRQVLSEFAQADTPVVLANLQGDEKTCTLGELLPYAFWREDIS